MKHIFSHIFFILLSFGTLFFALPADAQKLMPEKMEIMCGYTNGKHGGEIQYCDILNNQMCVLCVENVDDSFWADVGSIVSRKKVKVYHCQSSSSSLGDKCEYAMNGGLKGDEFRTYVAGLIKGADKEGKNCIVYNYFLKYSNCYGCVVAQTLTSAFVKAAAKAYNVSKKAGNTILLIGMMLWMAFFALKNVSSFATIEPMQMLQQFFVQCFKVILAMVILNSGLETILRYTLVPIIKTGTDIADTIAANVDEVLDTSNLDMGDDYAEQLKELSKK